MQVQLSEKIVRKLLRTWSMKIAYKDLCKLDRLIDENNIPESLVKRLRSHIFAVLFLTSRAR